MWHLRGQAGCMSQIVDMTTGSLWQSLVEIDQDMTEFICLISDGHLKMKDRKKEDTSKIQYAVAAPAG